MRVIGLTGGMGTGKSQVSRILQELGATVIDADRIGHDAYAPGTEGWREVVKAFGEGVLQRSGEVDRKKLASLVFADPTALARLNNILHPMMARMMAERIRALERQGAKVVVLEAALLIEADWTPLTDEVWVTAVPEEVAIQRVRARNGLGEEAIRARFRTQLPQEERVRRADVVIENSGDLDDLRRTVTDLWEKRIFVRKADHGPK